MSRRGVHTTQNVIPEVVTLASVDAYVWLLEAITKPVSQVNVSCKQIPLPTVFVFDGVHSQPIIWIFMGKKHPMRKRAHFLTEDCVKHYFDQRTDTNGIVALGFSSKHTAVVTPYSFSDLSIKDVFRERYLMELPVARRTVYRILYCSEPHDSFKIEKWQCPENTVGVPPISNISNGWTRFDCRERNVLRVLREHTIKVVGLCRVRYRRLLSAGLDWLAIDNDLNFVLVQLSSWTMQVVRSPPKIFSSPLSGEAMRCAGDYCNSDTNALNNILDGAEITDELYQVSPSTIIIDRIRKKVPLKAFETRRVLQRHSVFVCNHCLAVYSRVVSTPRSMQKVRELLSQSRSVSISLVKGSFSETIANKPSQAVRALPKFSGPLDSKTSRSLLTGCRSTLTCCVLFKLLWCLCKLLRRVRQRLSYPRGLSWIPLSAQERRYLSFRLWSSRSTAHVTGDCQAHIATRTLQDLVSTVCWRGRTWNAFRSSLTIPNPTDEDQWFWTSAHLIYVRTLHFEEIHQNLIDCSWKFAIQDHSSHSAFDSNSVWEISQAAFLPSFKSNNQNLRLEQTSSGWLTAVAAWNNSNVFGHSASIANEIASKQRLTARVFGNALLDLAGKLSFKHCSQSDKPKQIAAVRKELLQPVRLQRSRQSIADGWQGVDSYLCQQLDSTFKFGSWQRPVMLEKLRLTKNLECEKNNSRFRPGSPTYRTLSHMIRSSTPFIKLPQADPHR